MILVSIIIPIYNVEKYILRCLESVVNQTYKNYEVLLIDDCGEDSSIEIAENFISNLESNRNRWRIFHHSSNLGLSAARNTGIKNSNGDYLFFLDSDDAIMYYTLECLVQHLFVNSIDIVIGNIQIIGSRKINTLKYKDKTLLDSEKIISSYVNAEWYSMACNKLIRKNFLLENNLFFKEGILHEDELWSYMTALKAKCLFIEPQKTYKYYLRDGSISSNLNENNFLSNLVIILEKFKYYESVNDIVKLYLVKSLLDFYYSYFCFAGISSNFLRSRDALFSLRSKIKINVFFKLPLQYKIKYFMFIAPITFFRIWTLFK